MCVGCIPASIHHLIKQTCPNSPDKTFLLARVTFRNCSASTARLSGTVARPAEGNNTLPAGNGSRTSETHNRRGKQRRNDEGKGTSLGDWCGHARLSLSLSLSLRWQSMVPALVRVFNTFSSVIDADLITPCTVGPSRQEKKKKKKRRREKKKICASTQGRVLLIYVVASVKRRASINHPRASRGSVGPSSKTRATRIDSSDKCTGEETRVLITRRLHPFRCFSLAVSFVRRVFAKWG